MLVQLLITAFVAGFIGIVALGHVLLMQAIFAIKGTSEESADRAAAPVGPWPKPETASLI
jgi:hypothetical protein